MLSVAKPGLSPTFGLSAANYTGYPAQAFQAAQFAVPTQNFVSTSKPAAPVQHKGVISSLFQAGKKLALYGGLALVGLYVAKKLGVFGQHQS